MFFRCYQTNMVCLNLFVCIAMQTGFGWSNGVVLAFLEEFGWPQDRKIDCDP